MYNSQLTAFLDWFFFQKLVCQSEGPSTPQHDSWKHTSHEVSEMI